MCLNGLKSYLSDRSQCVMIGSALSDIRELHFGVLQGSILGPVLIIHHTSHFYADDTQFFIHVTPSNANQDVEMLKLCFKDIRLWLCPNEQKLNADKTKHIWFLI